MATHYEDGPEKRYVQLHRAIENGQANDKTWRDLCSVSYRLGYINEAIRSVTRIKDPATRKRLELWLTQKGVVERDSGIHAAAQPGKSARRNLESKAASPYAKPTKRLPLRGSSLREEVFDSVSYLFLEHIPFTVMAVTLMFPLVIGLGGMFTAGTEFWIFPAIALVPVLCIAGLVGSLAQQILLESSHGFTDPPRIPEFGQLVRRSALFGQALLASTLVLLVPGIVMTELMGVNGLPLLIAGALLFPIALALCLTRSDFRGLHPMVLMPAMVRIGMPAIGATVAVWALFLPAVVAMVTSEGSALFLRLSIIGPLGIAPLFVSSRLIGRVLYLSRDVIDDLMWTSPDQVDAELCDPTVETYSAGSVEHEHAIRKRRRVAPATAVSKKQRRRRQGVDRLNAPAHPEQRPAPQPAATRRSPAATRRSPAATRRSPLRRAKPEIALEDAKPLVFGELDDLPAGFRVLQGADRINAGAAARSPEKP